MPGPELQDRLRALPSVDRLLESEPLRSALGRAPRSLAVHAAREELERCRDLIQNRNGSAPPLPELAESALARLELLLRPSLRPVINATGVILHTNLGRAPLAEEAIEAVERVGRGYSSLEYDLDAGARGSRHAHVERLIMELTGAEAALAVNNNAAAVLLALSVLAAGSEVIISRGQLIEIGGSFRIPEILAVSGARLVEVGTTNRTRWRDYKRKIGTETAAIMRVHPSNFRTVGFTGEVSIEELCALAREGGLAMIDDLGSGVIADPPHELFALLDDEPVASRSIAAGADVVCFSGDKLLGGPQAGLIAGRREAIDRLREHPLARAVRIDKLSLGALEATLRAHREPERALRALPVLRMLGTGEEELATRAGHLHGAVLAGAGALAQVEIVRASGRAGGGSLPLVELEGPVVSVRPRTGGADRLHAALRAAEPPVIARVREGALLLDPRTMTDADAQAAAAAVTRALG